MNSTERWEKIKETFEAALTLTGDERRAYLQDSCGDDVEMRREIESLLDAFQGTKSFLETPAVSATTLAEGQMVGHYEIVRQIGAGGMGEVYLATDTKLHRKVAIKVLHLDVLADQKGEQRLLREAMTAAKLDHPNICSVYEIAQGDDCSYIVMQYIEGETLADRLKKGPLDIRTAVDIAAQVADALDEAHQNGVIHRDIKPANIIITEKGRVKVLDFGLARFVETESEDQTAQLLSTTGAVMGTVPYMSPEQLRGERLDSRTDIFSFGAMLYEMLTGIRPFARATNAEIVGAILHEEPSPPFSKSVETIPDELNELIAKSLAKNASERYQNIQLLHHELTKILTTPRSSDTNELIGRSDADGVSGSARPAKARRTRLFVFAATAGLLGLFAVSAIYYSYQRQGQKAAVTATTTKLRRLTFGPGLQGKPTWSPDGESVVYHSDQSGNLDLWRQNLAGGDPVQLTRSPADDWQPALSPDGQTVAFRSERDSGGLFVLDIATGAERRISSFGYHPKWSPDGSMILFYNTNNIGAVSLPKIYVTNPAGGSAREIWPDASESFRAFLRADWHPDSKRISFMGQQPGGGIGFWTVSLDGSEKARSEITSVVEQQIRDEAIRLLNFVWSPSGTTIYLEGEAGGIQNLYKVTVEPESLSWKANIERLTTGPGRDTEIDLSRDGTKLVFTTQSEKTRVWSFPLDSTGSMVGNGGQPITSESMDTGEFSVTGDGKSIAFVAIRAGKIELWTKSLVDGAERLLKTAADGDVITSPRWSRDASRIAFALNHNPDPASRNFIQLFEKSIIGLSVETGEEWPLTTSNMFQGWPWDWSADGNFILGSSALETSKPEHWGLYFFPVNARPAAEKQQTLLIDDPRYNFWQGRISPDGNWVSFLADGTDDVRDSYIGLTPREGGQWKKLTNNIICDKPRWSADGKLIYFYSNREGFRNIWAVRFDPATGKAVGEPFAVTKFQSPSKRLVGSALIGNEIMVADLAINNNHIFADVTQVSGNLWVLENIE